MNARPSYREQLAIAPAASSMVYTAMLVALKYSRGTPSVVQLQQAFGMSQSNAYRWRAAIKAAKGEP